MDKHPKATLTPPPGFYDPKAGSVLSEESETTINKDNLGNLCEKLLCLVDEAVKSGLSRGVICCGAARPSPIHITPQISHFLKFSPDVKNLSGLGKREISGSILSVKGL